MYIDKISQNIKQNTKYEFFEKGLQSLINSCNDYYNQLISSDNNGTIIIWMFYKNEWKQETKNKNKHNITNFVINKNGWITTICRCIII